MSREIKFRAWDTENNKWVQVSMGADPTTHNADCPISVPVVFNGEDKCVIMQYTGLKDKNGVEIYEGDILKSRYSGDGLLVVKHGWAYDNEYYSDSYGWYLSQPSRADSDQIIGSKSTFDSEYRVVGNIYENKELLDE